MNPESSSENAGRDGNPARVSMTLGRLGARVSRLPPGLLLFVAVLCLNLASGSREIAWGDARPVYEVAESIVSGQGLSVRTRWPSDARPGRDGRFYAPQPLLPSLLHVPGAGLRAVLSIIAPGPEMSRIFNALACHLSGSLLGALVVWLFFRLCLRYGARPRVAVMAAALLATGSMLWVYARSPFTEIVQVTCFTGFFLELSTLLERPDAKAAFWAGLWAGMLINTKYIYALVLPGAFLVVVAVHLARLIEILPSSSLLRSSPAASLLGQIRRVFSLVVCCGRVPRDATSRSEFQSGVLRDLWRLLRPLAFAGLGLLPGVVMALFYNYVRFGSLTKTGYTGVGGAMVENVLVSTWGFLFSPGKSIFLYSPPLLLAVLGLPGFWRGHRAAVMAMLATILPVALFYGSFPSWPGDWAWGPRYLVFAIPVLLLPAVSFLSSMRWPGRSFAALVLVIGIFVQVLGNAFYWDHYLRIALDVRTKWLGQPNRTGSLTVDKGGFCEGCFEDVYPTVWLGPFQPMLGHLWLLRHVPFGDSWQKAYEDAPWRRHTRIPLDGKSNYDRVRVDHWFYDTDGHRVLAWLVLLGLLGTGSAATVLLVKRTRSD